MDRRRFLLRSLVGTFAAPLAAEAQSARTPPRVGFIGNADPKTQRSSVTEFVQGLRDFGLVEGQSVTIEYRWAQGDVDRLPALVADVAATKVDVIVASGSPSLRALQQATSTIPVVMILLVDPVSAGFVASHARPGGNITGLASQYEEIVTKQVQLIAEAVRPLSRILLLRHTSVGRPVHGPEIGAAAATAAEKLGITARIFDVTDVAAVEGAFRAARDAGTQAMLVLPSPFLNAHRHHLIRLAASYRLPVFYELKTFVRDGGLMSYGPSIDDMFRRAASFVARILNGAKPADLPIERPTNFELIVNLKTAKALGLTIPLSLLLRADQIIE